MRIRQKSTYTHTYTHTHAHIASADIPEWARAAPVHLSAMAKLAFQPQQVSTYVGAAPMVHMHWAGGLKNSFKAASGLPSARNLFATAKMRHKGHCASLVGQFEALFAFCLVCCQRGKRGV